MSGFDKVEVSYLGETKYISADSVLRVAADVEELVTFGQLFKVISNTDNPELFRVSRMAGAYVCLLNHAGFEIDDKKVLQGVMSGKCTESCTASLMKLFVQFMPEQDEPVKKPKAVARSRSPKKKNSSKRHT